MIMQPSRFRLKPGHVIRMISIPTFFCLLGVLASAQSPVTQVVLQDNAQRTEVQMVDGTNTIQLCGLTPGQTYGFMMKGLPIEQCLPEYTIINGGWSKMGIGNPMSFKAMESCAIIEVALSCDKPYQDMSSWFSVFCMDCKKPEAGGARYGVSPNSDADYLIREVFIGGGCFDVSGVSTIGNANGLGEFDGGGPLGIDRGVIIACGNVTNSLGPNNQGGAGNSFGEAGDADLSILAGQATFDATGIEFDFAPTVPQITFNYAFASEEYPEYVCAIFNDVFGFFISGPGISGAFSNNSNNIAWIPNTTIPVGINSINPGVAGSNGNPANCQGKGSLNYSQYYVDNTGGSDLQYDGWTTVLQAVANVEVCGNYHIKLVVADAGDGIFDSAVFLEANSFTAGGLADMSFEAPSTGSNIVYENCDDGIITICKSNPEDIDTDVTLEFFFDASSTATPGVDYVNFPTSFFIPAGEECIEFQLDVIPDQITEGIEVINLGLELPCSCENPFVVIQIADTPPLGVELEDFTVCQSEQVDLNAVTQGGVPDLEFSWSTGEAGPGISIFPDSTGTYSVTVTDECGQEQVAISNVTVIPRPIATLQEDLFYLCQGDTSSFVEVTVTFKPENSAPWTLNYSVDGEAQPTLTNITTNPLKIKIKKPGLVVLDDVASSDCTGTVEGLAFVEENKVEVAYDVEPVSCQGIEDGKIQIFGVGLFDPYEFFWSGGYGYTDLLEPVGVGKYYVTITDAMGCTKRDSVSITVPSDISVSGVVTGETECFTTTGSVNLTVGGGQGPYEFLWSNGNTQQNPKNLPAGLNSVTVTDSRGCETYADFLIIAKDAPKVDLTPLTVATCGNPLGGSCQSNVTGGVAPYSFNWTGGIGNEPNPKSMSGGSYSVTVTDNAGCTSVADVEIGFDTLHPLVNILPKDSVVWVCGQTSLQLDATAIAQTGASPLGVVWSASNGGSILSGGSSLQPLVGGPGNYLITVTDPSNGCESQTSIKVVPDLNAPLVKIEPADVITCDQQTIVLDASQSSSGSSFTIQWTTNNGTLLSGAQTLKPTVGSGGTYLLTIINTTNNCISYQEVTVPQDNQPPVVAVSPPAKLTCSDPTLKLDGSASQQGPGISYSWTTSNGNILSGAASNQPLVNQKGSYTLVVTNTQTGCTNSVNVTVLEDKVPPVVETGVSGVLTCKDKSVDLIGLGSSTGSNFEYRWTTFAGNITGDPKKINTTVDVASTYLLTVTNLANGCQSSEAVQVLIDTVAPIAFAGLPAEIDCKFPQKTLDGSGSSNTAFFEWLWTTANGNIVSGAQSLQPVVNKGGVYTLTVTNSLNGCTSQSTTSVTADFDIPDVVIEDPEKLTCLVDKVILDASGSDFNTNVTFVWTTSGGLILNGINSVNPTVGAPGVYTLTSQNAKNGCNDSESIIVVEDKKKPIADAGDPNEIYCLGDSVMLDGSGSSTGTFYTYDWYQNIGGPAVFLNEQSPLTSEAGSYYLVVTDTRNGCTEQDQVVIAADYLTSADVKLSDPVCFNDLGTLEVRNVKGGLYPYKYSVNGGQNFQNNPRFRNLSAGLYQVVVQDARGCEIEYDYEIPVVNEILIHVEPDITINLGDAIRLEAQLNIENTQVRSVTWSPAYGLDRTDSLVVLASPYISTPYFVTVIDTNGCEASTDFRITVNDPEIFIPNVFSPYNNDGRNDILMIFSGDFGIEQIDLFEVFTRWGERVFHAEEFQPNDEAFGWDGLYQTRTMNPAVFVYYAKVRLIDGRVLTLKGDVTLVH